MHMLCMLNFNANKSNEKLPRDSKSCNLSIDKLLTDMNYVRMTRDFQRSLVFQLKQIGGQPLFYVSSFKIYLFNNIQNKLQLIFCDTRFAYKSLLND